MLSKKKIAVSDTVTEINHKRPFKTSYSPHISPKTWPFLYTATLIEHLLKMGCMRVGSKDISYVYHLLYISPSIAEIPSRK